MANGIIVPVAIASTTIQQNQELLKLACNQFAELEPNEIRATWRKLATILTPQEIEFFRTSLTS